MSSSIQIRPFKERNAGRGTRQLACLDKAIGRMKTRSKNKRHDLFQTRLPDSHVERKNLTQIHHLNSQLTALELEERGFVKALLMTFLIRDQGFVPLLMERRESALPLPSGNVMLIGVGVLPFFLYEFKPGSICLLWDSFPFRVTFPPLSHQKRAFPEPLQNQWYLNYGE